MTGPDTWGAVSRRLAAVLLQSPELVTRIPTDAVVADGPAQRLVRIIRRRWADGLDADYGALKAVLTPDQWTDVGGEDELAVLAGLDVTPAAFPRILADTVEAATRDGLRRQLASDDRLPHDLVRAVLPDAPEGDGPAVRWLADVEELPVRWLAPGLIPWGALTQIVGRGGQGKTTFAALVAAAVSRGDPVLPGMPAPPVGRALLVSAEDSAAHVLKPRVRLAGGAMDRVAVWDLDACDLSLPDDVARLEREVVAGGVHLVVLDPLAAFLGRGVDSHRDADLRRVLRPLHQMAERTGVAVLGILHVNKAAGGDVAQRVNGGGAWINAARSALVFGPPPDAADDDPARVVAVAKSNYAPLGAAFTVRMVVPPGEHHPRVEFVGVSSLTARDVLGGPEDRTGSDLAAEWLTSFLRDGPRPSRDVKAAAAAADFTQKQLRTARERLGVRDHREGFPAVTTWSLPHGATVVPMAGGTTGDPPGAAPPPEPHGQGVIGLPGGPVVPGGAVTQPEGTTGVVGGAA